MKGIIVYKGKYGATQQYAAWLGAELNLEVVSAMEINGEKLAQYDYLLIGTSVYIGKLQMQKWLRNNLPFIREKKIFLFQVAGTPPAEKEKRQAYNLSGIPKELISQCEFYFLAGRMIRSKLSWMDGFMLKMGARLAKDPADRKSMLTDYDDVRKENIREVTAAVRKFLQPGAIPA
jgi:menaquinone-dependent protoporphyrinogen IX oxidase